jgi:hypothetical protein
MCPPRLHSGNHFCRVVRCALLCISQNTDSALCLVCRSWRSQVSCPHPSWGASAPFEPSPLVLCTSPFPPCQSKPFNPTHSDGRLWHLPCAFGSRIQGAAGPHRDVGCGFAAAPPSPPHAPLAAQQPRDASGRRPSTPIEARFGAPSPVFHNPTPPNWFYYPFCDSPASMPRPPVPFA